MKNQFQHLTLLECNELLKLLQKTEELFDGTLGTCKTSSIFQTKRKCGADMFNTISSNKGTQIIKKK